MNYSPIQLDIIRTFGSKELSEGYLVNFYWDSYRGEETHTLKYLFSPNGDGFYFNNLSQDVGIGLEYRLHIFEEEEELDDQYEILGHIPELFPDVARVAKEKGIAISLRYFYTSCCYAIAFENISNGGTHLMSIKINETLPLIDQDESTLVQLLNLFK